MFRVAARAGMALDSSMTYDVHATVKVESDYPDGKRLGLVAKENQGAFAHYWTQQDGTIEINETFYWGDASSDSTTLQFMLGYAGEDHDQTGNPEAYKVYIDEVKVFERPTVAPTGISINEEDQVMVAGKELQLSAMLEPAEADQFIKWSSKDETVAEVDEGIVKALSAGETYIYAKSIVDPELVDSVLVTVTENILNNGGFELGIDGWELSINASEVGTTYDVVHEGAMEGDSVLLVSHPAAGSMGMWRLQARTGIPLDSGYTYQVSAKMKCITDYPMGKRVGIVLKEAQPTFAEYFFVNEDVYEFEGTFIWDKASSDSITLMSQFGYAGDDLGDTGDTLAYDLYLDDVIIIKRETIAMDSLDIPDESLSLTGGAEQQVNLNLYPENADYKRLSWNSNADTIVSVQNGVLTPVGIGEAMVYVEAVPWGYIDSVAITVSEIDLTSIEIVGTDSLEVGLSDQLTINWNPGIPVNNEVTWTSSDEDILTIDEDGNIDALMQGTVTVTATSTLETLSDNIDITVFSTVPVTGVSIDQDDFTILDGEQEQLTWVIQPDSAGVKDVSWKSSDDEIATVTDDGLVSAVGVGTADIIVTTLDGGFKDTVTITVDPIEVTGISLDKTTATGYTNSQGGAIMLDPIIEPGDASDQTVEWTSSDEDIATVSSIGLVTFLSNGEVTITATTVDGGFSAECVITVETVVTGISISSRQESIAVGESLQLEGNVLPKTATNQNVSWVSSDETVVTVDETGLVTAVGAGQADVTVTSEDGGKFISCAFTVTPTTINSLSRESVTIYPVPAKTHIMIKAGEFIKRVKVYDLTGTLILDKTIQSKTVNLNVSSFESGMYILKIDTNTGQVSSRIVKQ